MDNAKKVLHFLDWKLLRRILKALLKTGLNKKAKSKQVDSLKVSMKRNLGFRFFQYIKSLNTKT